MGYIRNFHPDLVEPWGTGISIAQFGDIVISLYFNYFDLSEFFVVLYFIVCVVSVGPMLFYFNKLENLRNKANEWVKRKSFLDMKRKSVEIDKSVIDEALNRRNNLMYNSVNLM